MKSGYRYEIGQLVRNIRPITTRQATFPIGMVWRITKRFRGYSCEADTECPHCGVRPRASRLDNYDLEPVRDSES